MPHLLLVLLGISYNQGLLVLLPLVRLHDPMGLTLEIIVPLLC
jgi:hypothetical protein